MELPQNEYAKNKDSLDRYLNEMGLIPLLSPEDEKSEVAKMVPILENLHSIVRKNSQYLNDRDRAIFEDKEKFCGINFYQDILSRLVGKENEYDEFKELIIIALNEFEPIKKNLTEVNLRLVVSIAKKRQNQGLSLADLIQYGNIGLINGVLRINPRKKNKLATHLRHWIRQSINRNFQDNELFLVRHPVYIHDAISKVRRITKELDPELRTKPKAIANASFGMFTTEQAEKVLKTINGTMAYSLNTPMTNESDSDTFLDFIPGNSEKGPEEIVTKEDLNMTPQKILKLLSPEIRQDFINYEIEEMTLKEIANQRGISREAIRLRIKSALRILRNPLHRGMYTDFFDSEIPIPPREITINKFTHKQQLIATEICEAQIEPNNYLKSKDALLKEKDIYKEEYNKFLKKYNSLKKFCENNNWPFTLSTLNLLMRNQVPIKITIYGFNESLQVAANEIYSSRKNPELFTETNIPENYKPLKEFCEVNNWPVTLETLELLLENKVPVRITIDGFDETLQNAAKSICFFECEPDECFSLLSESEQKNYKLLKNFCEENEWEFTLFSLQRLLANRIPIKITIKEFSPSRQKTAHAILDSQLEPEDYSEQKYSHDKKDFKSQYDSLKNFCKKEALPFTTETLQMLIENKIPRMSA